MHGDHQATCLRCDNCALSFEGEDEETPSLGFTFLCFRGRFNESGRDITRDDVHRYITEKVIDCPDFEGVR